MATVITLDIELARELPDAERERAAELLADHVHRFLVPPDPRERRHYGAALVTFVRVRRAAPATPRRSIR
jgi:hypothetical protein